MSTDLLRNLHIGLTDREIQSYSWLRALRALAFPGDRKIQDEAAFERDASAAAQKAAGRTSRGMMVPTDVIALQRDMVVGTPADGGYLKGTDQRGDLFINRLFNSMVVRQMGATVLPGLVGDVAIPKMTAGHTAYWVDESTDVTESKPTLGQVPLAPKTVGALSDISRKLLLQSSPSAEALVKDDLALTLALGIDLAALHGTGANDQPTGIAATSGIGTANYGGTGGAPALSHLVKLESEVATDNAAMGKLGYLTNAKVRGKLRQTFPNSTGGDIPLWENGPDGRGLVNGYPAMVSNQVRSDLTTGGGSNLSAIFFGNWADLLIGLWGGLDLIADPYSLSAKGWLRVVALQSVDVAVRHPESFAVMLDASTV